MSQTTNIKYHPNNIITWTREITWLGNAETGWGNGYIAIPQGHSLYGQSIYKENTIPGLEDQEWTYSDEEALENAEGIFEFYWVFGFDCAHYNQNLSNWPESRVIETIESIVPKFQPKMIEA